MSAERESALEMLEMPLSLVTTSVGPIGRMVAGGGGTRARSSSCAQRVDVKGRAIEARAESAEPQKILLKRAVFLFVVFWGGSRAILRY